VVQIADEPVHSRGQLGFSPVAPDQRADFFTSVHQRAHELGAHIAGRARNQDHPLTPLVFTALDSCVMC